MSWARAALADEVIMFAIARGMDVQALRSAGSIAELAYLAA